MKKGPGKIIIILVLSLCIVAGVFIFLIYKSDTLMVAVIEKGIPGARTLYNVLSKWEQQLNPFIAFKYNLQQLQKSDIPAFRVQLSSNDLRFFEQAQQVIQEGGDYIAEEAKAWRKAEMEYNGKKYDIEIRIRGMAKEHGEQYKKSYKIKILNNENINGITSFNLILPEDRYYYIATLTYFLAEKIGAPVPENGFANLFFNNYIQGIYFFSEDMNKKFLEHIGFQTSSLFDTDDSLIYSPLSVKNRNDIEAYVNDTAKEYALKEQDNEYFAEFLEALQNKDYTRVYEMIDIDQSAKFAAIISLFQDTHMLGANVKYYLNGANGKIIPLIWDLIPSEISEPWTNFDNNLLSIRSNSTNEIFVPMLSNPEFLQLRNNYLYELVKDDTIDKYLDAISKKMDALFMMDTNSFYSYRMIRFHLREDRELIKSNAKNIRAILEFNEVYATSHYGQESIDFNVSAQNLSYSEISVLKLKNINKIYPGAGVKIKYPDGRSQILSIKETVSSDSSLVLSFDKILIQPYFDSGFNLNYPQVTFSVYGVEFKEILPDNITIEIKNGISGLPVKPVEIKYAFAEYYRKSQTLDEGRLKKNGIKYSLKENQLNIYSGTYYLKETYRLPGGIKTNIEGGTTLVLGPDVSLIFSDSVSINGLADRPVVVKNMISGKPFGSLAIIGQADTQVSVSFLNVYNGKDAYVDGVYLSGAFSVYYAGKTVIKNSGFFNSSSDDGINIKYSKILLENNVFKDNYSDQLDLDFCEGVVNNNDFKGPLNKYSDGDGMDISGSLILIENSKFEDMGDKGISIGEGSTAYVVNSELLNNHIGSAIKDNSAAYFYNNKFEGNTINLSAYQKKDLFGGGTIIIDDKSNLSSADAELDEKSQLKIESIEETIKRIYDEFLPYRD